MTSREEINKEFDMIMITSLETNENKRQLAYEVSECIKLLDDAILMHDIHIKDPKTAIPESQEEMMKLMLDTKNCITRRLRVFEKGK